MIDAEGGMKRLRDMVMGNKNWIMEIGYYDMRETGRYFKGEVDENRRDVKVKSRVWMRGENVSWGIESTTNQVSAEGFITDTVYGYDVQSDGGATAKEYTAKLYGSRVGWFENGDVQSGEDYYSIIVLPSNEVRFFSGFSVSDFNNGGVTVYKIEHSSTYDNFGLLQEGGFVLRRFNRDNSDWELHYQLVDEKGVKNEYRGLDLEGQFDETWNWESEVSRIIEEGDSSDEVPTSSNVGDLKRHDWKEKGSDEQSIIKVLFSFEDDDEIGVIATVMGVQVDLRYPRQLEWYGDGYVFDQRLGDMPKEIKPGYLEQLKGLRRKQF